MENKRQDEGIGSLAVQPESPPPRIGTGPCSGGCPFRREALLPAQERRPAFHAFCRGAGYERPGCIVDPADWDEFYRWVLEHEADLFFGVVSHFVRDPHRVSDIFQEVCLRTFLFIKKECERNGGWNTGCLIGYLRVCFRNTCVDHFRRESRHTAAPAEALEPVPGTDPSALDQLISGEEIEEMVTLLEKVADDVELKIIALKIFGASTAVISEVMGMTPEAIYVRLHRLKKELIKLTNRVQ